MEPDKDLIPRKALCFLGQGNELLLDLFCLFLFVYGDTVRLK